LSAAARRRFSFLRDSRHAQVSFTSLTFLCLMTLPLRLRWLCSLSPSFSSTAPPKAWFESQTVEGWRQELIRNFIYLVHSRNPGLAFGIFSDSASAGTRTI